MDGNAKHQRPHDEFRQRLAVGGGGRLSEIMADLIDGVGLVIEKHHVTPKELRAALRFATEVGLASDEKRQEYVLLSDVFGLTALAEQVSALCETRGTTPTLSGPFYRPDAPPRRSGDTISLDGIGLELTFEATIADSGGAPLKGVQVEVWHANSFGEFENQKPDRQPEFNLRGRFVSDANGKVVIRTIRPGRYRVPDEGPVGQLMRALGLSTLRPAHLQFRISAPGFHTLTTHVFDRSDPNIDSDPLFCVADDLLADFGDPAAPGGAIARFCFTLAPATGRAQ